MTKREAEQYRQMYASLERLGLDSDEVDTLSRAAKTLHRWAERECNGEVERDEDTGKTYGNNLAYRHGLNYDDIRRWRVPDRETGALQRIHNVLKAHPDLWYYQQTDPRGCSLYVGRVADMGPDKLKYLESWYNRGIAIW